MMQVMQKYEMNYKEENTDNEGKQAKVMTMMQMTRGM